MARGDVYTEGRPFRGPFIGDGLLCEPGLALMRYIVLPGIGAIMATKLCLIVIYYLCR